MTYPFSLVPEGPLGRLHVRRAHRSKQLQHVLPNTEREEDVLSTRQPGPLAADADPARPAAGQPVGVCPDADEEVGGGEASAVRRATAQGQAEATAAVPPQLRAQTPEAEPPDEEEEQESERSEEEGQAPEGEEKTRVDVDDDGDVGGFVDDGHGVFSVDDRAGGGRALLSPLALAASVALLR